MATQLALIAHDRKKDDLVAFVRRHQEFFGRYDLIATGTTGKRVREGTGLTVEALASGPLGGDAQIASRVVAGEVAAVFFFLDPLYAQPHEPDIRALLRICEVYDVPLATNGATAEAIVSHFQPRPIAHLIFNPVAGQNNPDEDLALIRRRLDPVVQLRVQLTEADIDPAEQARSAIAAGVDLLIASGGDGTLSAIAAVAMENQVPLGVIPRGTANAFAAALGIPGDIAGACDVIRAGTTRTVDVARCNGQPLILLAGIGFEAEMVERANRDLKNRLGVLAYLLAGVQQFHEQTAFKATIDLWEVLPKGMEAARESSNATVATVDIGETLPHHYAPGAAMETITVDSSAITVANAAPATSVLAQGFGRVLPDDGFLDVTIATPKSRLQGLNTFTSLFTAALINAPTNREDILCLRTRRLRITTDPPQKVAIDGEIIGTTPVTLDCIPQALTVFAPLASRLPQGET